MKTGTTVPTTGYKNISNIVQCYCKRFESSDCNYFAAMKTFKFNKIILKIVFKINVLNKIL